MAQGLRGAAGRKPGGPVHFGLTLLGIALAGPAAWAQAPAPGDTDPTACRNIADDQARLRCYDSAVDGRPAAPGAAAPAGAITLDSESLFGRPPEESRALTNQELGLEDTEILEATVAGLSRSGTGKLVIRLHNGQVWTQVDTTTLSLAPGDPIRIREAALGSYLLQKQSGGRSLRVRRTQ